TVGVFEDAVSRNVARQDRYRIHVYLRKVFSEPAFQAWRQALDESRLQLLGTQHATRRIPDSAFFWRQMPNVFGEQIDLRARWFSIGPAAANLAFARHRPVILGYRHCFDHLRVEVIGKNAVKLQMMERCIICGGLSYGVDNELDKS